MTSSRARIAVLGGILAAGFVAVLVHLWFLMVQQNDTWTRRSYENRWAFRSVPSQRGALLDRNGKLLAYDVPATRVSLHYQRFRLYHPVGAAVHGAILWASLLPERTGTTYYLRPGPLGPRDAVRDLLGIPVRMLVPGALEKDERSELASYLRTVLSSCSGLSRAQVGKALREAALAGTEIGVGDVLPMTRSELLQRFDARLDELYALGDEIAVAQHEAARRDERMKVARSLLDQLEELRLASLSGTRLKRPKEDAEADVDGAARADGASADVVAADASASREDSGDTGGAGAAGDRTAGDEGEPEDEEELGMLVEEIRRPIADDVPFELSARLRVDPARHPGIEVEPWVQRRRTTELGTSLDRLVGTVRALDRTVPEGKKAIEFAGELADARLRAEWEAELVPDGIVADAVERQGLRDTARLRLQQELLRRERRGLDGFESRFNHDLMGVLGMRFVEHDSRRREHRLWSHLRVEAGQPVQLTIDVQLQAIAERVVRAAVREHAQGLDEESRKNVRAGLAVIDALSGDLLAYAGAPLDAPGAHRVPGLSWGMTNGSIGSLAKPFVLLEHLESERLGRPYQPSSAMRPCSNSTPLVHGGVPLRCDHDHWDEGRQPVAALAKSCNSFFYQAGIGLGTDGLERAFRRFGLLAPPAGDPYAACWQSRVEGLFVASCAHDKSIPLPRRAIGYGVQASPLLVARAYAGLATGVLPRIGTRFGERRERVPLGDMRDSLDVVHEGMRGCVEWGSGKSLAVLQELGVLGKTGTAEIGRHRENNAWFAGFLPAPAADGLLLSFCAVVYYVPDKTTGAKAAGVVVSDFLEAVQSDGTLRARYMP